jgi:hypothetical protein
MKGLGFRVKDEGFWVSELGLRFKVWDLGFRV